MPYISLGKTRPSKVKLNTAVQFSPPQLFRKGEVGIWYDPSDVTTLFQDSIGTTPVTALGQPVGLVIDKSRGGLNALGPELVDITNLPTPTIDNSGGSTTTWNAGTRTITMSVSGTLGLYPRVQFNIGMQIGKTYQVRMRVTGDTTFVNSGRLATAGGANVLAYNSTTGILSGTQTAASSRLELNCVGTQTAPRSVTVQEFSVREVLGVHLIQPTAASRPTWQIDGNGAYYLNFDGVDDSLYTATNLDLSGTDKLTVCAGIRKNIDTGGTGTVIEFGTNVASATGSFSMWAPHSGDGTNNVSFNARANSSTYYAVHTSASVAAPVTLVMTGLSNIGGPLTTLRTNGIERNSSATNIGTGNYSSSILYVGRRNNTLLPFNGRIHSLIIRGTETDSNILTLTERWVAQKTGISI